MMRTLRFVLLLIPLMALGAARQKRAVEFPDQLRNMWAISGVNPTMFVDTGKGLFRSLDDGKTWLPASSGLPASIGSGAYSPITAIAATDSSRIYALTEVNGVYRTSTGGATWDDASSGLPVPLMRRTEGSLLAIDPVDGRRLFLLLRAPVTSHHIRTLLFQSSDAGTSWGLRKDLREETFMAMAAGNDSLLTLISEDGSQVKVDTRLDADSHAHLNVTDLLSGDTAPRAVQPINDRDIDNIAVIEDDGSMLVKQFDLSRKSFEFRPNGEGGYSIHAVTPVFDSEIGDVFELFDDDARMMAMPFSFRFYDRPYQTIFINSNGSVSFERGERAATASM
ncbi:MAG: hypothetical protein HY646_14560, partial [Acidobacteria bacterium]|nr:hypothetical protein [Acidobacteriota bacterium]